MWEAILGILTSGKGLIGIGTLIILLAILARKGLISFKGHGLKVGVSNEEELAIVRTQIQWCESDCKDMLRELAKSLPECAEMNEYKAKYTVERVLDCLVQIVIFNHVTLEPTYVKMKQDLVWAAVSEVNPEPMWDKLEPIVKDRVAAAIKNLYEIRQYYSK